MLPFKRFTTRCLACSRVSPSNMLAALLLFVYSTFRGNMADGDVLLFDWSTLTNQPRQDRHLFATRNDLESEFGTFERPTSYVQKVPRFERNHVETSENRQKINALLKNYLGKLYLKKYSNSEGVDEGTEGKIFDSDALWQLKNKTKSSINKFFSLFQVVKFANGPCSVSNANGGPYEGTCYHASECQFLNGTAEGPCADNYGVCCVFKVTCGGSSNHNCTYFESPGYPNYDPPGSMVLPPGTTAPPPPMGGTPDPRKKKWKMEARQSDSTSMSCSVRIEKVSSDIQQMRIDFVDLELAGPTNGTCIDERLVISGQNLNNQVPVLCGYNSGQHVYVDVATLDGPLQLSVLSSTGARKRYKLRICQLSSAACGNNANCLQYYTGVTGQFSSFNYDQAMISRSVPGYFNNLNYAICIRKEAGYCSITYSNSPTGLEYPFQLRNVNDMGQSTVPPNQAGVEIFNCPDDYLVIGGVRLCGDKFNDGAMIEDFTMNAPVTDTSAGPIIIPFRTNRAITGRGFKLFYTQNRCMSQR